MYFTLKRNSLGVLNINSDGVCSFIQEILERRGVKSVSCRSFCLTGEDGAGLAVLNKKDSEAERALALSLDAVGIKASFVCARDVGFAYKTGLSLRSPWFWCSLTAGAALLFFVGFSGIFWLSFWGSIGWFSARFLSSRQVASWIASHRPTVGKD